ncbi:MAG: D-sedoheptulose 7-phosphate isomerase [Gaiellales bacterium]|nr:D-sedoheptulose 7-phosphate isomerase [Gaiellales bacterium]
MARDDGGARAGGGLTAAGAAKADPTRIDELLHRRTEANERFFAAEAERVATLCREMAERFWDGHRLIAFGASGQARSDARHVAVEFVHPVIVGKRALPAIGLAPEGGPLAAQVEMVAESGDMAIAFGAEEGSAEVAAALEVAHERGCLTIAFAPIGAAWDFDPPTADPFVRQELAETLYHVLWELVHVFFEHLGGSEAGAGASSFLYPFLDRRSGDLASVVEDVARSVEAKAHEIGELRAQTLDDGREPLAAAAAALRAAFDQGGRVLAFGNGGSATDAMDAVADFQEAPQGWPSRAALDLTADTAILTALANDIGPAVLFQRQIIAYGRQGDVALAFSTSGNSVNIIEALVEARKRGMGTIAMVGYDGGRVLAEGLADHIIVTRSEHIPRIQEAQASAYHVLRELVEAG